jgi:hypothetical protein
MVYTYLNATATIGTTSYSFLTDATITETHNVRTIIDRKQNVKQLDQGWKYSIRLSRQRVDTTWKGLPTITDITISNSAGSITFANCELKSGNYSEASKILKDSVTYECYSTTKLY